MPLPGNVRELENLLHRALALSDGSRLSLDSETSAHQGAVPSSMSPDPIEMTRSLDSGASDLPQDLQAHLDEQERRIIARALQDTGFNRTAAAARLGMSLRQIRYRMSRLGIEDRDAGV